MTTDDQEFALIRWIRSRVAAHPRLAVGIGDDAAAVRFPDASASETLITVDMLMEGVHFTIPPATARQVGRKAMGVNLSDIAAMAGRPLVAVIAVALPRDRGLPFARELHEGIQNLADEFDVALAGGDTNSWDGPLVVSVTLWGEATERGPVRRNGAQIGDWVMATGDFGGSLAGKHLNFSPRVLEALTLHEAVPLHAMIDVSDGLAADLHHLLQESSVGAVIRGEAVPISEAARNSSDDNSPLEHALSDGEDFELLFTVAPEDGRKLLKHPPIAVPLTHIGEIVEAPRCELVDASGHHTPLHPLGWQHGF